MFLASSNSVRNIHKHVISLDVCNKKTLAKPPSPNGHLARRDRGLLFSGKEIARWSPPSSFVLSLLPSISILRAISLESFSDPPTSRKRRRRLRELPGFPTDFSIKLRKRLVATWWDPLPSPSTDAPSQIASIAYVRRKRWRRRLRGKIAFPGLYRHAGGRTMSEARSISTGDYGSRGYSHDDKRWIREGCEGLGKKKGRMNGRSGENRRERM